MAPEMADQVPLPQLVQIVEPAVDHVPALQMLHWLADDALANVDHVPALHGVQRLELDPVVGDQLPAPQGTQAVDPAVDHNPALHVKQNVGDGAAGVRE